MSILDLDEIFRDFVVAPSDLPYFYSKEQEHKIHRDYYLHLHKLQASNHAQQPEPTTLATIPAKIPQSLKPEDKKIINKVPFTIVREEISKKIQIREDDQISNCSTAPEGYSLAGSPQTYKVGPKRPLADEHWDEEDLQKPQQKTFKPNNGGFIRNDVLGSPLPIYSLGTPQTPSTKGNVKGKGKNGKEVPDLPGSVKSKVRKDLRDHLRNAFSYSFNPEECRYLHNVLSKEQAKGVQLADFKNFVDGKSHDLSSEKIYREIINKCVRGFLSEDGKDKFNEWMEGSKKLTKEKKEEIYKYKEYVFGY